MQFKVLPSNFKEVPPLATYFVIWGNVILFINPLGQVFFSIFGISSQNILCPFLYFSFSQIINSVNAEDASICGGRILGDHLKERPQYLFSS
jgi:hypothetical protein